MPRYHFHVQDGRAIPDPDGTVLPDIEAARHEAIRLAGRLLDDHPEEFWDRGEWRLMVTDDTGHELFKLHFYATSAPGVTTPESSAND